MYPELLTENQIDRSGKYPEPKKDGYSSLHFHFLTTNNSTSDYQKWGLEVSEICKERGVAYYYFLNHKKQVIQVYPNEIIEDWWYSKKGE